MPLAPGLKLGPYEILGPLGAGGMGEVYRARDTRLGRDVAIKVLPRELSGDPVRKQRFEREAQLLAALNHPNIAHIYGVEESNGTRALVMELVEGPTIADRLAKGPLPLDESLQLARQIAEGLEYAHDRNIVHRDLKPANIKVTPEGQIKILDFGLAKALDANTSDADISNSPTISVAATNAGVLLGTAGYMSPEQAKGKPVDRRTDIWAFGCVLYEMLTGKPAFDGETITDKLAAVVRAEPELSQLPEQTPRPMREVIQRCLAKDPRQRLQAIGEARIALESPSTTPSSDLPSSTTTTGETDQTVQLWKRRALWSALAAAALTAALAAAFFYLRLTSSPPATMPVVRAQIRPSNPSLHQVESWNDGFTLSPDGKWFAFISRTAEGTPLLWLRALDSVQDKPLQGTDHAQFPFWSPDSRYLGFFADGKLKKIEINGSAPSVICDAPLGRGGTWNLEGTIVFAPSTGVALQRVSAAGGEPTSATILETTTGDNSHRWPQFLPDGRHFIFISLNGVGYRDSLANSIRVASLDSQETKTLGKVDGSAIYASGRILFLQQRNLVARDLDLRHLELTGDTDIVAEQVAVDPRMLTLASVSQTGLLTYLDGASGSQTQLVWVDRTGKVLSNVMEQGEHSDPVLSPDGKRMTYINGAREAQIWEYDFARDVKHRLTIAAADSAAGFSLWAPDGNSIAYLAYGAGKSSIRRKRLDATGQEETLWETFEARIVPFSWSADGKLVAVHELRQGSRSIWMLPTTGDHQPYKFVEPGFRPQFSPDGKWVAYCSFETGRAELFVVPFPGPGGKWQVSTESGCNARWRKDSQELYFLSSDKKLMAAGIRGSTGKFEILSLRPLFETHILDPSAYSYDVAPSGDRFIFEYAPEQSASSVTLVVNWDGGLKKP